MVACKDANPQKKNAEGLLIEVCKELLKPTLPNIYGPLTLEQLQIKAVIDNLKGVFPIINEMTVDALSLDSALYRPSEIPESERAPYCRYTGDI